MRAGDSHNLNSDLRLACGAMRVQPLLTPHTSTFASEHTAPMRRTRRDTRYLLSRPWEGTLRISGDVVVERHDEERNELWVLSTAPAHREEQLRLKLSGPAGSLAVRVVESSPVLLDGIVRHRLRLAIVG